MKLRQAGRSLSRHYDAYTAAAGLKTTQYALLSAILRHEPVQPSALAASLNLDASTLTRNLRPLIEHGWIDVLPGLDARSRQIVTTAAGRVVRLEAQHHWRAAQKALVERLGVDSVVALHALLDRVLAAFAADEYADVKASTTVRAPAQSPTSRSRRA